jgi:hypothetical protein
MLVVAAKHEAQFLQLDPTAGFERSDIWEQVSQLTMASPKKTCSLLHGPFAHVYACDISVGQSRIDEVICLMCM